LASNYTGSGYTDWCIPNRAEWQQIYNNRVILDAAGANLGTANYWQSVPFGPFVGLQNNYALYANFSSGNMTSFVRRNTILPVRPIRYLCDLTPPPFPPYTTTTTSTTSTTTIAPTTTTTTVAPTTTTTTAEATTTTTTTTTSAPQAAFRASACCDSTSYIVGWTWGGNPAIGAVLYNPIADTCMTVIEAAASQSVNFNIGSGIQYSTYVYGYTGSIENQCDRCITLRPSPCVNTTTTTTAGPTTTTTAGPTTTTTTIDPSLFYYYTSQRLFCDPSKPNFTNTCGLDASGGMVRSPKFNNLTVNRFYLTNPYDGYVYRILTISELTEPSAVTLDYNSEYLSCAAACSASSAP
jgi:hypothetical protein